MLRWISLFWIFVKINLLTTSGPASVGLLYKLKLRSSRKIGVFGRVSPAQIPPPPTNCVSPNKEAVGTFTAESEFVEAVGFSSALSGSDALQLAMFVGYAACGLPGALAALMGSILPPKEARRGNYDLVGLGSPYSAQSLWHLYMPNVTAEVAEALECPILTVRQGYG